MKFKICPSYREALDLVLKILRPNGLLPHLREYPGNRWIVEWRAA